MPLPLSPPLPPVTTIADYSAEQSLLSLEALLHSFGLQIAWVAEGAVIPGGWFEPPEAGLIGNTIYLRHDTPLHSLLHEACHYLCMSPDRRATLHTDAGGDDLEECAVNYLAILLADQIPYYGRERLMDDMALWGYSFRLGSPQLWFATDADDAIAWLLQYNLITPNHQPTGDCRHF